MTRFTAFVLVAYCFTVQAAFAGGLGPKKPSQLVSLDFYEAGPTTGCSFGTLPSSQVLNDGTSIPYAGIPEGQVLVITGMQVSSYTASPSRVKLFEVRTPYAVVATASCLADPSSGCQGSVSFPSGIPVKSGTVLCVNTLSGGSYSVTMQGYLTKDK